MRGLRGETRQFCLFSWAENFCRSGLWSNPTQRNPASSAARRGGGRQRFGSGGRAVVMVAAAATTTAGPVTRPTGNRLPTTHHLRFPKNILMAKPGPAHASAGGDDPDRPLGFRHVKPRPNERLSIEAGQPPCALSSAAGEGDACHDIWDSQAICACRRINKVKESKDDCCGRRSRRSSTLSCVGMGPVFAARFGAPVTAGT